MKYSYIVYILGGAITIAVLVAWFVMLSPFLSDDSGAGMRTIHLDGNAISVSVSDTDESRQLGLSGRSALAADEGMLFVFQTDGAYAFWMKDMNFPIDIIWISADDRIVYMVQHASPDTYPHAFVPSAPARYVLEVSAGYVVQHNVHTGDTIQL